MHPYDNDHFGSEFGNVQIGDHNTLITHADNVAIHNHFSDRMTARDFYANLLQYLEFKRVLYNPGSMEQREHCIASVLDMKQTLMDGIMKNRLTPDELQPVREMLEVCNHYLDKVGKEEGHTFIIAIEWEWFNMSPTGAMGKLRATFRNAIRQIEETYGLKYAKDIW